MLIGIVGDYGNDNNGDETFLLGVLKQLLDIFPYHSSWWNCMEFIQESSQLYGTYALITKNIEVIFFSTKSPQEFEISVDIYNRMVIKRMKKLLKKSIVFVILELTTNLDIVI